MVTSLSDAGIFTTVGAGRHYLAGSYRNCGVTTIDPSLAADLKTRTTYPPLVLSGDFMVNTVLSPQAKRDTDVPDLGYEYDPLDYALSGLTLTNATLLLTNAVAIAVYGGNGLMLQSGAKLISSGTPEKMNRVCPYYESQEAATNWGSAITSLMRLPTGTIAVYPEVDFRFTDFSMGLGSPQLIQFDYAGVARLSMRDCRVLGGSMYLGPYGVPVTVAVGLTNNLVESAYWWFDQGFLGTTTPVDLQLRNNLFYRGTLYFVLDNPNLPPWYVHDNFFCTNSLSVSVTNAITNSYNAYYNTAILPATWGNNKTNTSASFQTGWLGRFYYPTNGGAGTLTDLVDAGSRYATNASLYAFTTATNQTKEAGSKVDIGFHFAAGTFAGPTFSTLDTDGDTLWDWWEDWNLNGSYDAAAGETDWQVYTSLFGIGPGPGLVVFTPLK